MQLVSLTLENFKCHEYLEIRFDGRNANIYGKNDVGKSSIYDSFTWLLFGKDSLGRRDFDINPLNLEGAVRDSAAITSVEAVLRVDGAERKLKRTYYEVWSTKRGSAEATRDGNSSDYFVDDVSCKKAALEYANKRMIELREQAAAASDELNQVDQMLFLARIDVISTRSRLYGVQVPLFFDKAESVTDMERTDTQLIRLIVSENDKELRCELV